jgi:Ca2+-binding RTX toxin-like protein
MDGDDEIWGGGGRDTLTGGNGHDAFVLEPDKGAITITDFSTTDDQFRFSRFFWDLPSNAAPSDYVVINKDSDAMPTAPDSAHAYFLASDNAIWFDHDGKNGDDPVKIADYNRSNGSLTLASFEFIDY